MCLGRTEKKKKTHQAWICCHTPPCVSKGHSVCRANTQDTELFPYKRKRDTTAAQTRVNPNVMKQTMLTVITQQINTHCTLIMNVSRHRRPLMWFLKRVWKSERFEVWHKLKLCIYIQTHFKVKEDEYLQRQSPAAPWQTAFSVQVLLPGRTDPWLKQQVCPVVPVSQVCIWWFWCLQKPTCSGLMLSCCAFPAGRLCENSTSQFTFLY